MSSIKTQVIKWRDVRQRLQREVQEVEMPHRRPGHARAGAKLLIRPVAVNERLDAL